MAILILYATTEGQTLKIARHAQRHLADRGHPVELIEAETAIVTDLKLSDYGAVLLMGSVHAGNYQPALVAYAARDRAALDARPNAFISVSLSAAGTDPEDREALETVVGAFQTMTGWTPKVVEHVAGAFRFSRYNWFKTWAMRYIQSKKDPTGKQGEDVEFTDWDALERFLDTWVETAEAT